MSNEVEFTFAIINESVFMSYIIVSLIMSFIGLLISYLILREFKIANQKEPCKFSEKLLRDLITKIDKVMITDKVKREDPQQSSSC
jgi:hypothetical protein